VRTAFIEGLALWAPTLPGWDAARAAFRGESGPADPPLRRPPARLLPAAERRRAPQTVAFALEVAVEAVAGSGRRAHDLLSVFTSAHGDLATTDYLCRTLAQAPTLLSPTRFRHSVHNAASGHWGIATGCRRASTAVSASGHSFAAGLLEALTQCAAEEGPALLVGYDMAAVGALASTNDSRGLLGVALVLAPQPGPHARVTLDWSIAPGPAPRTPLRSEAALPLASNGMADALPLFEALAWRDPAPLALPLSATLALQVRLPAWRDQG
jgi:hypothetical protein